jgi:hypothetical protein
MEIENNIYKEKYLKYKIKYSQLKTLYKKNLFGGTFSIPKNDGMEMLTFVKNITLQNVKIRFSNKQEYQELLDLTNSVTKIDDFKKHNFEIIFTKGYDRLFRLVNYILEDDTFIRKSNNCKALIVAQFIIINQVFGDGNHRTAIYVLENYSSYSPDEIKTIMSITERIHYYSGDLKYLWTGMDGNFLPNFTKLYDNEEISGLLKK